MALINPELLDIARQAIKEAFVPSDQTMQATGAPAGPEGAPPGPEAGAMPPAGDPSAEGQPDLSDPMVQAALQEMLAQGQGGGALPAGPAGGEIPGVPPAGGAAPADEGAGGAIQITVDQLVKLLQSVSGKSGSTEDLKRLKAENSQLKQMLGMPDDATTPAPSDGGTGGDAAPAGMNMGQAAPETLPMTAVTPNGPIPKQSSVNIAKIAASLRRLSR